MEIQAKKSLGQHFLNSKSALSKIIETGKIEKGEVVLEIGPGTGILTQELLDNGAKIIAVEKDQRSYDLLLQKYPKQIQEGTLNLIYGDILEIKIDLPNKYKIIANIPYYITGAILQKFLEGENKPQIMVLLVQKEVAQRILAKDGKESILSVSVKAFGKPSIVSIVPKGAFVPPPKVDSAILLIENISSKHFTEQNLSISDFFSVIKSGFAHKRKLLIKNLEILDFGQEKLTRTWNKLGLDNKVRAEDINIESWLSISKELTR